MQRLMDDAATDDENETRPGCVGARHVQQWRVDTGHLDHETPTQYFTNHANIAASSLTVIGSSHL